MYRFQVVNDLRVVKKTFAYCRPFSLKTKDNYSINCLLAKLFQGVLRTWERVESDEKKWYKSSEVHWMDVPILHMSRIRKSHFAAIHDVSFFFLLERVLNF